MQFIGQIPPIPKITGEGRAMGDSFAEWHEHFENVAGLVGWDDLWKLVHLKSNLRDTAMAFYRLCSTDVRSKYPTLVAAMKRRFTFIRLTAVQAKLFHTRKQLDNETVDQFAQELYNLAYAGAASEGPYAERMGQTLLANQFETMLCEYRISILFIPTENSTVEVVTVEVERCSSTLLKCGSLLPGPGLKPVLEWTCNGVSLNGTFTEVSFHALYILTHLCSFI